MTLEAFLLMQIHALNWKKCVFVVKKKSLSKNQIKLDWISDLADKDVVYTCWLYHLPGSIKSCVI
jgi:hypothetical protein